MAPWAVALLAIGLLAAVAAMPVRAEAPAALKQLDQAFVEVAAKITPSVVNISSTKKAKMESSEGDTDPSLRNHPFREFFGDEFFKRFKKEFDGRGIPPQQGLGSGVIVSADGFILTNSHVVKDADEVQVTLSDRRSFKAKLIGADPESDIAVVKIDATGLPAAKIGDSSKIRVGEIVVAVGNPFGFSHTVTQGIVSAKGRTNVGIIRSAEGVGYEDFIQTDAAINPGNSGGPLVNIEAELIGINTAIASRSGGNQGVGFAIPSNSAKLILEDIMKEGKVRRGLLGVNIQDLTQPLAKSYGRETEEGALVQQVIEGSPAEKAGIKAGDIIVQFNGKPIRGAADLKNLVGRERPNATSTLTVYRDKKTFDVSVLLAERTKEALASLSPSAPASETANNDLGIEIETLPAAAAQKLGLPDGGSLRVKDLKPSGAGAKMGMRPGDVILEVDGKAVSDVTALNTAIAAAKEKKVIRVKVKRGKGTLFLAATLG
ncbi:MAG: DegQ family serine endoprotease [Desulfomonile tiedjei]|nr:DegQ family serine endoprotease [Desulfomonile tiedjei]